MQNLNEAKCNLGKVKIEPMLVASLYLTGISGFPPKRTRHDVGWPGHKGLGTYPSLVGHFACFGADLGRSFCLCLRESAQIQ